MIGHWIARLTLALLLGMAVTTAAAEVNARVDRDRLAPNETLTLHVSVTGKTKGEPDFTVLDEDFEILGQNQSRVTSIVNGEVSRTHKWTLDLLPKKSGEIRIPPLAVGAEQSEPIVVQVIAGDPGQPGAGRTQAQALFVRAGSACERPYVQQVCDYRVKIYYREPLQRAVLSEPSAEGATLQRIGDDRAYDDYVEGRAYRVIERRYRLIPQRSGMLTVTGPRLEALLPQPDPQGRRDPFADLDDAFGGRLFQGFPDLSGLSRPGRHVVERAPDLQLEVRAQPEGVAAAWLPAESIQLADEWAPATPRFRVGEAVTRTLTITASGASAAQLPTLDVGRIDGAQIYPDQPQGEDLSGDGVAAVKTLKVALVPTRSGVLTLPEIRLPWWDVRADQARVAVVPARVIEVEGTALAAAPAVAAVPVPSSAPSSAPAASSPVAPPSDAPEGVGQVRQERASGSSGAGIWPLLTLVLAIAWLSTLGWWLRERRARQRRERVQQRPRSQRSAQTTASLRSLRRAARTACQANDARAARAALMAWARQRWPEAALAGLDELGERLASDDARLVLAGIDRASYAAGTVEWDGSAAWAALGPALDSAVAGTRVAADPLPKLYPDD